MNAESPGSPRAWLAYLFMALFVLTFQEAMFRFVFPLPEVSNFNRVNYSRLFREQNAAEIQPLSNAAFTWASDPDGAEFVHHLNLYGFRDVNWDLNDGTRVMFVGDSFTEGFMAADDQTIPHAFESASARHGTPVEAMNLGVGASGMHDYLSLIADAVPLFRPQAVILVLYANDLTFDDKADFLPGPVTAPEFTNTYLPRAYVVIARLMKKDSVATRWSKTPFQYLPTVESGRNPLHDETFARYAKRFVSPGILEAMRQGRFNPFVINEYSNYEVFLPRPTNMTGAIEPLKTFVESHGSKLFVVHIPYKAQVSDHYLDFQSQYDENKQPTSLMTDRYQVHAEALGAECGRLQVPFLDMTAVLRKREASGERMYWDYDEHMKASAYLVTGEKIYNLWRSTLGQGSAGS